MSQDDTESPFPWECKTSHHYEQVEPWCRENFGPFGNRWFRYGTDIAQGIMPGPHYDHYRFQDEKDAVLFQLKWS